MTMAASQKFVAVFLVCMFVLAATSEAAYSSVYRSCFDSCLPACINKGKDILRCEKGCDTECTAKEFKAKLYAMKVRSRRSKPKKFKNGVKL